MTEIYSWKESSLTYEANTLFIKDFVHNEVIPTLKNLNCKGATWPRQDRARMSLQ